jgi:hypothetical protein
MCPFPAAACSGELKAPPALTSAPVAVLWHRAFVSTSHIGYEPGCDSRALQLYVVEHESDRQATLTVVLYWQYLSSEATSRLKDALDLRQRPGEAKGSAVHH